MPSKKTEVLAPQTEPNPEIDEMIASDSTAQSDAASQTDTMASQETSIGMSDTPSDSEISQTDVENQENTPPGSEDAVEFLNSDGNSQTDMKDESDDLSSAKTPDADNTDTANPQTETVKAKRTRRKTASKSEPYQTDTQENDKARDGSRTEVIPDNKSAKPSRSGRNVPVVSIDEERTVETEADKTRNDLLDLVESQKSGKILSGTIQGIETSADNQNHSFAVIYHGNYKVIIPVSEGVDPPEDFRGVEPDTVLRYMMTKRLGAEVDYIVKGIDAKDNIAVASRVEAMKIKRKQYYFGTDRDGNNLIYSGICAEARVVSVIRSGLFADIFGLEVYIPLRELSYQRWMDAAAHFQPGQRILVKILEVDRKSRTEVAVKASVKQAAENPYEKALKRYSAGNRYVGTVSMVDTNGVFVALDGGIDCLCSYPKRGRPPRGARVTVRIMGINYKSNRIWGAITHIATPR